MASIRLKPNSPFWYACITGKDGKQKQFSTGLEDEAEARAVAHSVEAALGGNRVKPHQLRGALDRLADQYAPR